MPELRNQLMVLDFKLVRIHSKTTFDTIKFNAEFKLIKKEINPFDFLPSIDITEDYKAIEEFNF